MMLYSIFFLVLFQVSFLNGWASSQTNLEVRPDINVKGKFLGEEIENITINKLYKNIPVYVLPLNEMDDPTNIISYIDLIPVNGKRNNVEKIELLKDYKNNSIFHKFKEKTYIRVMIKFFNNVTKVYLMEEDAVIRFHDSAGVLVEIKMIALHNPLIINSFDYQEK